jgi:hypothetical protein
MLDMFMGHFPISITGSTWTSAAGMPQLNGSCCDGDRVDYPRSDVWALNSSGWKVPTATGEAASMSNYVKLPHETWFRQKVQVFQCSKFTLVFLVPNRKFFMQLHASSPVFVHHLLLINPTNPAVSIYCSSFLALREFVGQLVTVSRAHYKTCLFFEPMGKDKDHNKWLAQYFSPSNFPHIYHQKVWIHCTKLWDVGVMPRQAVHSKLYHSAGYSCITMGPRPASMRMI